jgi:hypothetical protein
MFTEPTPHSTSTSWKTTIERLLVTFQSLGCPINPHVDREGTLASAFNELCIAQSKRTRRQLNPTALLVRLNFTKAFQSAHEVDRTFNLAPPNSMVALLASVYFTTLAVIHPPPISTPTHSN